MLKKKFKVFLLLLFFISLNAYAEVIEGKALVIDGDTIKIKNNKTYIHRNIIVIIFNVNGI